MTTFILSPETAVAMCEQWFASLPSSNEDIYKLFHMFTVRDYSPFISDHHIRTLNDITNDDVVHIVLDECSPCHQEIILCTPILEHIIDVASVKGNSNADNSPQLRVIVKSGNCFNNN